MKYPALLPADQVIAELDMFDSIIDVRSPAEFALDHIPGAINCPVLNDAQRVTVGTLYKQQSPFEARKLGAAIVARNIGHHLEQHFQTMPKQWKPLIYCWRGGNRSGSMALIFAKVGWPVVQLDGGYKAYRHSVMHVLEHLPLSLQFRVICGTTGSGKSRLLQYLEQSGAQVLDLEQLAAHRGSVLGSLPLNPQPSQKMFETRLWQTLRRFTSDRVVYVESESKKIGDLRVPAALMDRIRSAQCVQVQLPTNDRVKLLIEDYPHLVSDTELLVSQLSHLTQLHGKEKIHRWQSLAETGEIAALVETLLVEHYDPAYLRSIEKNFAGYINSRVLTMPGIEKTDFLAAAQTLIAAE
jgi:tRNA 2-selenouridine synthase